MRQKLSHQTVSLQLKPLCSNRNVDLPLIYRLVPAFIFQITTFSIETASNRYSGMAGVTLEFLFNIFEAWKRDRITLKTAQDVFSAVLQVFISNIRLADFVPLSIRKAAYMNTDKYDQPRPFIDTDHIRCLVRQCFSLDLVPQLRQLNNKLDRLTTK